MLVFKSCSKFGHFPAKAVNSFQEVTGSSNEKGALQSKIRELSSSILTPASTDWSSCQIKIRNVIFSHRYSLSSKGNQLHHWISLLVCRTPRVVWPSTWAPAVHAAMYMHTSLSSPSTSRLCCRSHRDWVKPAGVSLTHLTLCLLQQTGQEFEKDVLAVLQVPPPEQTWAVFTLLFAVWRKHCLSLISAGAIWWFLFELTLLPIQ